MASGQTQPAVQGNRQVPVPATPQNRPAQAPAATQPQTPPNGGQPAVNQGTDRFVRNGAQSPGVVTPNAGQAGTTTGTAAVQNNANAQAQGFSNAPFSVSRGQDGQISGINITYDPKLIKQGLSEMAQNKGAVTSMVRSIRNALGEIEINRLVNLPVSIDGKPTSFTYSATLPLGSTYDNNLEYNPNVLEAMAQAGRSITNFLTLDSVTSVGSSEEETQLATRIRENNPEVYRELQALANTLKARKEFNEQTKESNPVTGKTVAKGLADASNSGKTT